jgi:hypothetical protein
MRQRAGGEIDHYRAKFVKWRAMTDEDGHYCFGVAL